jgi:hypothetical protein
MQSIRSKNIINARWKVKLTTRAGSKEGVREARLHLTVNEETY